ncbi:putative allantoate permease [Xylaria bambusicola]|uniref:putative allantoate permease n=1 Tax=Xylaria bambusicola TaxID=326684 RepID=UPI0020086F7B|nr:putative allantoate permease [Xylaria bambusicola]KAI0518504.1 putative allantoate permease [Xylaria bambusicola]
MSASEEIEAKAVRADPQFDHGKLLRKIDVHVLPILFAIYVAAFIDRVNISSALTLGLTKDLELTDQQPNIALTIFFIPYIIFEIPSNILLKKFNPHIWLPSCIIVFGIVTIAQGFVQSYSGLLATRFLLGLAESGIFPGSFYLISFWYKQDEAQKRFTFYWSSTIIAGAFGGLLASAISKLNGVRGLSSWRWVFILEGIATVLIGFIAFFSITDFPREAKWLSHNEREFLIAKTGASESHDVPVTARDISFFLAKPKNLVAGIMYLALLIPSYSFVFFIPTIVQGLGYGTVETQLHSVPPFAAAFGFAIVTAYISDKARLRLPFILFGLALLITGLSILIVFHDGSSFSIKYAALCLVAMGTLGIGGNMICWYVMNLQGHVERSIGSAWLLCFGNLGGIIATFSFLKKDAPYYHTGYVLCISFSALCVIASIGYGWFIWLERKDDKQAIGSGDVKRERLYI